MTPFTATTSHEYHSKSLYHGTLGMDYFIITLYTQCIAKSIIKHRNQFLKYYFEHNTYLPINRVKVDLMCDVWGYSEDNGSTTNFPPLVSQRWCMISVLTLQTTTEDDEIKHNSGICQRIYCCIGQTKTDDDQIEKYRGVCQKRIGS